MIGLTLHISYALAVALVYPWWRVERQARFRQRWAQGVLQWLHVRYANGCSWPQEHVSGALLVANHISWLDVLVIKAQCPAHFVAKAEVGRWPLLGWLVRRAGTLLVRRDQRSDTRIVNQQISALLRQGQTVVVFAQGTSTPATEPVRFHASLLQSAIDAHARVHPVVVYYQDALGQGLAAADFVGDTSFMASLWQIACTPRINVNLTCLPALEWRQQSRRILAEQAQHAVNTMLMRLVRDPNGIDQCHANAIEKP